MPITPTNVDRIKRAARALSRYSRETGQFTSVAEASGEARSHELDSVLIDLLTDLRHAADATSIDFFKALDMSYQHYLAEKQGGQ